jgi:hypothetical protein
MTVAKLARNALRFIKPEGSLQCSQKPAASVPILSQIKIVHTFPPDDPSLRSFLILSSYLRLSLQSGLFSSGFQTKILYTSYLPMRATCAAHFILFILTS